MRFTDAAYPAPLVIDFRSFACYGLVAVAFCQLALRRGGTGYGAIRTGFPPALVG